MHVCHLSRLVEIVSYIYFWCWFYYISPAYWCQIPTSEFPKAWSKALHKPLEPHRSIIGWSNEVGQIVTLIDSLSSLEHSPEFGYSQISCVTHVRFGNPPHGSAIIRLGGLTRPVRIQLSSDITKTILTKHYLSSLVFKQLCDTNLIRIW